MKDVYYGISHKRPVKLNSFFPEVRVLLIVSNSYDVNDIFKNSENNAKWKSITKSGFPKIFKSDWKLKWRVRNSLEYGVEALIKPFT